MADATPNPTAPPAPSAVPPVTKFSVPAQPGPVPAHPAPAAGMQVPPGMKLVPIDTPEPTPKPARPPQYLAPEAMAAAIRAGGSVLHHDRDDDGVPTGTGRLITKVEHLPGAAHLARGNPEAEARARADLEAQRAAIDAEIKKLDKSAQESAQAAKESQAAQVAEARPKK